MLLMIQYTLNYEWELSRRLIIILTKLLVCLLICCLKKEKKLGWLLPSPLICEVCLFFPPLYLVSFFFNIKKKEFGLMILYMLSFSFWFGTEYFISPFFFYIASHQFFCLIFYLLDQVLICV